LRIKYCKVDQKSGDTLYITKIQLYHFASKWTLWGYEIGPRFKKVYAVWLQYIKKTSGSDSQLN